MADISPITAALGVLNAVSGAMTPYTRRGFNASISGTFAGTITLQRQLPGDSGSTWRNVTSWTAPVETTITDPENGVIYRWQCTAYTSGTANVRLGQA